jgi:hypothetical protein
MDPNYCLNSIRKIITKDREEDIETRELLELIDEREDLINCIEALDERLSKGGCLPSVWSK